MKARRVSIHEWKSVPAGTWDDNPNGDFHLAPVDGFEVVPKGTLEMAMNALLRISTIENRRSPHLGMVRESGIEKQCIVCIAELARRALTEIGGGDE